MQTPAYSINVPGGNHAVPAVRNIPQLANLDAQGNKQWSDFDNTSPNELVQRSTTNHATQKTAAKGVEFRHPREENNIRENRTAIGVLDELLTAKLVEAKLDGMRQVLEEELRLLDLTVRQGQIALAQTYLVSPIAGIVTTLYKDVGESVTAGEPVVRVENDAQILVVGRIQCRGSLRVGLPAYIETDDTFDNNVLTILDQGRLVAIRGHEADNDEWDVIMEFPNPNHLPINYQFDKLHTRISLG